jgi:hypothetical protein
VLYGPAPNRDTLLWRNTIPDTQLTFTYSFIDSVLMASGLPAGVAHELVWTATAHVASSHRGAERAHVWNVVRGVLTSSLSETADNQVVLYPNPTRDRVVLAGLDDIDTQCTRQSLRVYDLMGRQIPVDLCVEEGRLEWSVVAWPRGTYLIQFVEGAQGLPRVLRLLVD